MWMTASLPSSNALSAACEQAFRSHTRSEIRARRAASSLRRASAGKPRTQKAAGARFFREVSSSDDFWSGPGLHRWPSFSAPAQPPDRLMRSARNPTFPSPRHRDDAHRPRARRLDRQDAHKSSRRFIQFDRRTNRLPGAATHHNGTARDVKTHNTDKAALKMTAPKMTVST